MVFLHIEDNKRINVPAREFWSVPAASVLKHRRSEETAVARQCKVEIQEYAVGVEPCDTSSSGFRLRTMQEHAGYTLNMAVTGSLEPHQAVVHYRTTNEVVVAGVINSEMRTLEFSKITH